ncbi:VWA domain-containing protein [Gracilibacillus dipsosauri]|uniref:VWA domain-containing protein n=1 Tax=Gracilibacillus dipsosauri TaxID=178340 RepID=UPI0024099CB9
MKKHVKWISLLIALLLMTGCGDKEDASSEEQPSKKNSEEGTNEEIDNLNYETYLVSTVEERMQLEPGDYSGEKYKEEKIKDLINQFPKDLSGEEYYSRLLALTAEDYRNYYEFFNNVDTSFESASSQPGEIETPDQAEQHKVNIEILFDASGSMGALINGKTKMELAKNAIDTFVSELPEQVNISLRVYGHKGTGSDEDKELSCSSTEEIYPLGHYDEKTFNQALDSFSPAGWTPLASAIQIAKEDLSKQTGENVENIIYVVSDGVETCDGDPIKVAKDLNESDIEAIVNIIGFDVDDEGQQQLKKVAEAGKGKYSTVRNEQELKDYFEKEKSSLINEWFEWESENVNKYFQSESERVNKLFEVENEMVTLAQEEENRIIELSYYMEETLEIDGYDIREIARDLGYQLREYARDTAYQYREELRNKGYENREKVRDEAYEKREKLRNDE